MADSSPPSSDRPRRRKRIGLLVIFVLGLLCLVAVLPNLIFLTEKGRGLVTKRIENRTQLNTEIGHLSWSPWKGFVAKELRLSTKKSKELPEVKTLLTLKSARIFPHWESLLKGGLALDEIHLDGAKGEIPIEALANIIKSSQSVKKQGPVAQPPQKPIPQKPPVEKPPVVPNAKPPQKAPPAPKAPQKPTRPPAGKKTSLRITNSAFTLYSLKGKIAPVSVSELEADIPLSGEDRDGHLTMITGTMAAGQEIAQKITLPLQWKRPFLNLKPTPVALQKNIFILAGQLAPQGQSPFRVTLQNAPETKSIRLEYPARHLTCQTGPARLNARFEGALRSPSTWRGNLVAQAESVSLNHLTKGELYEFETSHAVISYANGTLQIPSARFFSEDFSLTANGYANTQPDAKAVIRLVAARNKVPTLRKLWMGSRLGSWTDGPFVEEFETPDRFYRDLEFQLDPIRKEILVNLGPNRQYTPLLPVVKRLQAIIQVEDREEFSKVALPQPKAQKTPSQTLPKTEALKN